MRADIDREEDLLPRRAFLTEQDPIIVVDPHLPVVGPALETLQTQRVMARVLNEELQLPVDDFLNGSRQRLNRF